MEHSYYLIKLCKSMYKRCTYYNTNLLPVHTSILRVSWENFSLLFPQLLTVRVRLNSPIICSKLNSIYKEADRSTNNFVQELHLSSLVHKSNAINTTIFKTVKLASKRHMEQCLTDMWALRRVTCAPHIQKFCNFY